MIEYVVCYVFRDRPWSSFTTKEKAIAYIKKTIEKNKKEFGRDETNLFRLYEADPLGRMEEIRWVEE